MIVNINAERYSKAYNSLAWLVILLHRLDIHYDYKRDGMYIHFLERLSAPSENNQRK